MILHRWQEAGSGWWSAGILLVSSLLFHHIWYFLKVYLASLPFVNSELPLQLVIIIILIII